MHRFTTCALILSLCLFSIGAFAQENRVVRVGVAIMQNQAGRSVSGSLERDRLVAALNGEKPDKKLHVKVQGVPLEGARADEVSAEVKEKKCDYVVYTTLVELQSSTDPTTPNRPGTIQTNPAGVWSNPPGGRQLDPEYAATVEYRLYRTGDPNAVAGAPFSNRQPGPEEAVVSQVMNRIANQVFAEIKKSPPPMQE